MRSWLASQLLNCIVQIGFMSDQSLELNSTSSKTSRQTYNGFPRSHKFWGGGTNTFRPWSNEILAGYLHSSLRTLIQSVYIDLPNCVPCRWAFFTKYVACCYSLSFRVSKLCLTWKHVQHKRVNCFIVTETNRASYCLCNDKTVDLLCVTGFHVK